MTVTGTQARYELSASGNPTAHAVTGGLTIGTSIQTVTYDTAPDIVYSLVMQIADGDALTFDPETGAVTGTVAGTNQVETATVVAASGITGNGNATCVFTSPLVTGSPLSTSVAVTTALTTATLTAGAIRTALQAVTAITDHYTIGGTGADITATALVKAANDATLNISTANGTCTGITTAATSANTTAGVATSMAYRITGTVWDAVDAEGVPLQTATKLYSVLYRGTSETENCVIRIEDLTGETAEVCPVITLHVNPNGNHLWIASNIVFTADGGDVLLYLDIHAGT